MVAKFEWDQRKAASNTRRHGVSFEEALTVFANPLARIFDDEDQPAEERREVIVGHSLQDRLLVICFTEREGAIRIISARKATENERKDYEEGVTA
jgi:uncharacterized DUF497 family protein